MDRSRPRTAVWLTVYRKFELKDRTKPQRQAKGMQWFLLILNLILLNFWHCSHRQLIDQSLVNHPPPPPLPNDTPTAICHTRQLREGWMRRGGSPVMFVMTHHHPAHFPFPYNPRFQRSTTHIHASQLATKRNHYKVKTSTEHKGEGQGGCARCAHKNFIAFYIHTD